MDQTAQRLPAEQQHQDELAALARADTGPRPPGWQLSPRAVRRFILGDADSPAKIVGHDALVERCIATLAGQRGLMLVGEPGTAKSLLSELLAAAICGSSTHTVQGGAGVIEEQIRYSWNYALLLRDGPVPAALVPGPLHAAMASGQLMRFEEITRCPVEVQDLLVPVLSERLLHIPELADAKLLLARPGFNVIATANLKDRGVNEMSAALKRRFNFETLTPLTDRRQEIDLVDKEVRRLLAASGIESPPQPALTELLVTAFQELRQGQCDGTPIDPLSSVMSTAEAVQVLHSASVDAHYLGDGAPDAARLRQHLLGSAIKDNDDDRQRLSQYLKLANSLRPDALWQAFTKE